MSAQPVLAQVTDTATFDAVVRLRARVWRETGASAPNAFPEAGWRDATDDHARHWCVHIGDELVAAARLSVHAALADVPQAQEYLRYGLDLRGPVAVPARVVVLASMRRRGIAGMLLDAQDAAMRAAGACSAVRQASPTMRPALLRRGWRDVGAARIDPVLPGVVFQVMVLDDVQGTTPPRRS